MGLLQQRALQKLKETLPKYQAVIDAAVGAHLELAVDWDSYSDFEVSVIENALEEYGLSQIAKAIEAVCKDDLGKTAVRAKVKEIALRATPKTDTNALELEDGVLRIGLGDPIHTGYWGSERITELLESKL